MGGKNAPVRVRVWGVFAAAGSLAVLAGCGGGSSAQTSTKATTASTPTVARVTPKAPKAPAAKAKAKATHPAQPAAKRPATVHRPAPIPTTPARKTAPKLPASVVNAGQVPGALPVARASVNQVVLLHDLAVGATHLAGAPPGVGAPQASQLALALTGESQQLTGARGSKQPAGVSLLASTLAGYAALAKQVAARAASDTTPLSATFVATLKKLDGSWTTAVTAIGSANHVKLLAGMAPLLIPKSA